VLASALLFFQWRIGFIRRRLRFGALGFAQRGSLVSLSLFLLAPSTCRPRSLGSISSIIWLKCHHVSRWLITHLLALYNHVGGLSWEAREVLQKIKSFNRLPGAGIPLIQLNMRVGSAKTVEKGIPELKSAGLMTDTASGEPTLTDKGYKTSV